MRQKLSLFSFFFFWEGKIYIRETYNAENEFKNQVEQQLKPEDIQVLGK